MFFSEITYRYQKSFIYHGLIILFFYLKQIICYKLEYNDHSAIWHFYFVYAVKIV